MKKNVWSNDYETLRPISNANVKDQETFETQWTDKRTGAEYVSKIKEAHGPQGDFSVNKETADLRWRTVMGLPCGFNDRPKEDPFENDHLKAEPVVDSAQIQNRIRERATFDMRREMATSATSEPTQFDDFQDKGHYYLDPGGRVIDKAHGTQGPFGTEIERAPAPPSKLTRERHIEQRPTAWSSIQKRGPNSGTQRYSNKIEVLLSDAFRGLFGESVSKNVVRSSQEDVRLGPEPTSITRAIMNAGLMRPWVPNDAKNDPLQKPEQTEYAVGSRALQTLQTRNLLVEVLDLPRAERDDLVIALGRTILNSMTLLPEGQSDRPSTEERLHEEIRATIKATLAPSLLKGLIKSDAQDRPVQVESGLQRIHGPSMRSQGLPDRQTSEVIRNERPVITRATLGSFAHSRPVDPFNQIDNDSRSDVKNNHISQSIDLGRSNGLAQFAQSSQFSNGQSNNGPQSGQSNGREGHRPRREGQLNEKRDMEQSMFQF